jgi:hypothetical protein
VLIVGEDPNRHRFSRSCELGELVGSSVELPAQVYETQAVKFLLGAANRFVVDGHPRVMALSVAIHLIDHQLRVAAGFDPADPQLSSDSEASE